jgi:hypothetical protein
MQTCVSGIVVRGYRVASGPSADYPFGTLEKQFPIFKDMGLDLDGYFPATLNVSILPNRFEMINPPITFRQVQWTDLHPPEDFSFSPCSLEFKMDSFLGYVYYPHPETKIRHFENASILEIITNHIAEIIYGDRVNLVLNIDEVRVIKP